MADGGLRYKHRSFSQVKQLRQCGYQFFLERIQRVPSRPSVAAAAGVGTHIGTERIDHMVATVHPISRPDYVAEVATEMAVEAFEKELAERAEHSGYSVDEFKVFGFKPRMTAEWYRKTGIPNTMRAYVEWRLANPDFKIAEIPGHGPGIEVPFNYYIGEQLIHGSIDRVFTHGEQVCVLDIKSGKPPKTDEQLGLYAAALNKALGWHVEWGFYLHNLRKGEARITPPIRLSHWDDTKLGQVYLPSTQLIDLGIYIPSPGDACELCGVSDHCPFAQSVV